jgi:aryl-alcohol dehydrogenase-like predicted oxidoreductase
MSRRLEDEVMKRREFVKAMGALSVAGLGLDARGAIGDAKRVPRRPLGGTGVEVSVLALGGVIGMQLPPSPDHDPGAIAEQALDLGITYFDTAPSYNSGQSETNYGPVVARRRGDVFLATKTGDRSYDGTRRSIEQSLKRLQTDHVDLLQIHGVSDRDDLAAWGKPDGVVSALRKLRDEKVVRFLGVTGHDSAQALRRAIEMYEFDTLLTTLNPVSRRRPYREELLAAANRKQMGVIAMKVMGGGNGCLVAGNPLRRVLRPYHDQTDHQVEPSALIRYSLSLPVSTAVIGVANPAQLSTNATATLASPLDSAERRDLEHLLG